jgi:hypothetical protein
MMNLCAHAIAGASYLGRQLSRLTEPASTWRADKHVVLWIVVISSRLGLDEAGLQADVAAVAGIAGHRSSAFELSEIISSLPAWSRGSSCRCPTRLAQEIE